MKTVKQIEAEIANVQKQIRGLAKDVIPKETDSIISNLKNLKVLLESGISEGYLVAQEKKLAADLQHIEANYFDWAQKQPTGQPNSLATYESINKKKTKQEQLKNIRFLLS